jgi:murein DD-endopeptidase MepM/ murein hydrolase activator NlpD
MVLPRTLLIAPLLAMITLLANGSGPPIPGLAVQTGAPQNSAQQNPAPQGLAPQGPVATLAPGALWVPPIGGPLEVSGPYRAPPHRYGSGHRGIDLAARPGEAVIAPAAGTVSFSGAVVDRGVLSIRVDDRTVDTLEPVRSALSVGEAVASGAVVGEAASGGHCLAECVHLGVRVEGEYVNPLRYLLQRPVLLPLGRAEAG